jgi:hypothetical protein
MIPSLSNLRVPQILQDDRFFLKQIREQMLRRMKRKLYSMRELEYRQNERWTSHLKNCLHPLVFERLLAICNLEFSSQSRLMNNVHRRKLERLMENQIQSQVSPTIPGPPPDSSSSSTSPLNMVFQRVSIVPSSRIPNLTPSEISVLEKGPKFVPSQHKINETTLFKFNVGFQRLMHQIRWRQTFPSQHNLGNGFVKSSDFQEVNKPPILESIELKIKQASISFQNVMSKIRHRKIPRNITKAEWCAIRSLKNSQWKILPSDKGGDFCVCDASMYKATIVNHLSDESLYRRLSFVDVVKVENRVNSVWKGICKNRRIPRNVEIMYSTTASHIAVFKGLVKTHKGLEDIKIRPVVNTIGSPTYKIAWLLQRILQKTIRKPVYSRDSSDSIIEDIIERRSGRSVDHVYPFSLDVVSMYPSIPAREAADIFCEKLVAMNFEYCGMTPGDFKDLFKSVLDNSYLRFEDQFYKQITGLPIGNKISGMLADVYMDNIERPLINSLSLQFYYRYVDDCLLIVRTKDEAVIVHSAFDAANQHVKFEIEHPNNEGTLSLLDFQVNVNEELPKFGVYMKSVRSDIFTSGITALPTQMKQKIIMNEWRRLRSRCESVEDKKAIRKIFIEKLRRNHHEQIPFLPIRDDHRKYTRDTDSHVFYLSIPFVDDVTNTMVKRSLRGLGCKVRLTHKSPNLCNILNPQPFYPPTRNSRCNLNNCRINNNLLCFKSMVIYEAVCNKCENNYIGSTKMWLHSRIKQHFSQKASIIYRHNQICKGDWSFKVRANSKSLQSLRWGEAVIIKKENPTLNGKDECMQLHSLLV